MPRILVIDDEPAFRMLLAQLLHRHGHHTVTAVNGRDGAARFQAEPFDLVITDLVMPEMDGIETILAIRRLKPNARIIAMSGDAVGSPAYLQAAKLLGASVILPKPFDLETFLAAVQSALA